MKLNLFVLVFLLPTIAFSQIGVAYHQSNLPFLDVHYEVKGKLRPALRVGTDQYFEAISFEGVVTYDLFQSEEYECYAGLGVRTNGFTGLVVPVGINVYPFATKQFGFHIEIAPIIGDQSILRGSWGIRYKFKKKSQ